MNPPALSELKQTALVNSLRSCQLFAGLPPADLRVWLQQQGPGRLAELEAGSAAGQAWLAAVQETGRLRALPAGGP